MSSSVYGAIRLKADRDASPQETPIKVLVGANKEVFYIHESVIRKPETFFDATLQEEWKEGQERVVELLEDSVDHFRLYAQWLYTGKIFCKSEARRNVVIIARLYILGEKLLDRKFQDDVMNAMLAVTHDESPHFKENPSCRVFPAEDTIAIIYEGTPPSSPMRRLLVDYYVGTGHEERAENWSDRPALINHEFLIDLTKAMWEKRSLNEPSKLELEASDSNPGCVYHLHGKDEPCSAKK